MSRHFSQIVPVSFTTFTFSHTADTVIQSKKGKIKDMLVQQ